MDRINYNSFLNLASRYFPETKTGASVVESVYIPSKQEDFDFSRYADQINQLKSRCPSAYLTTVPLRGGNTHQPVYIIKGTHVTDSSLAQLQRNDGTSCKFQKLPYLFKMFDLETDREIGCAEFLPCNEETEYLRNYYFVPPPELDNNSQVILRTLRSLEGTKYKNVGVVLIKTLLQDYQSSCEGKMSLTASQEICPYFNKLGFRMSEETGAALHISMHLPSNAVALWKNEIQAHPIRPVQDFSFS